MNINFISISIRFGWGPAMEVHCRSTGGIRRQVLLCPLARILGYRGKVGQPLGAISETMTLQISPYKHHSSIATMLIYYLARLRR